MVNERADARVSSSVSKALASSLGRNEAKAVEFYVDSTIAAANPALYSRSLSRIFGEGAVVLLNAIINRICEDAGIERGEIRTLEECVERAKVRSGTPAFPAS